jgi:hypothetical protein
MTTALVVVGVSLVIILVLTAVVTLPWRKRVGREAEETSEDRNRREVLKIRHSVHRRSQPRTSRRRRQGAGGSVWTAGMTSSGAVLNVWAAGQDGGSTDNGFGEDAGGGASGCVPVLAMAL